jgi:hypothetical protein
VTAPFLCVAFSAYKRVIADVAIFPVRGRWRKCADARRSNADRAVDMYMMGGGGSARIGVRCEMPRGYMVRASHSGSCEHGCGDQCSRQKFGFSHFVLHLAGPLLGLSNNQTCIRAPLFRNTSAYFRTRSREHKVTRPIPSHRRRGNLDSRPSPNRRARRLARERVAPGR